MSICDDTCVFKIPENSSRVKGPQERIEVHQYFNLWYTKLQQNRVIQLMSDILHQTSLIDQLPTNNWIKKLRFSMINWVGVVFLFATPHPFNSPSFLSTFHQKTCFLSNTPYFHPPPLQKTNKTPGKPPAKETKAGTFTHGPPAGDLVKTLGRGVPTFPLQPTWICPVRR